MVQYGFGRDLHGYFKAFNRNGNTPSERKFRNYWQVTQHVIYHDVRRPKYAASDNLLRGNFPLIDPNYTPPYTPNV